MARSKYNGIAFGRLDQDQKGKALHESLQQGCIKAGRIKDSCGDPLGVTKIELELTHTKHEQLGLGRIV